MRVFFWCFLGALIATVIGWSPAAFNGRPERWFFYIPFIIIWTAFGVMTGLIKE